MGHVELIRVPLGVDISARLASMLGDTARATKSLDPASVIYLASNERRARSVSNRAGECYPEGTPERVARELLRHFAPATRLRGETERDFDMFAAVATALAEAGVNRRAGRPLVEQAQQAWRRFAQAVPQNERANPPWAGALGERGRLFFSIIRHYSHRLRRHAMHDPEDAPWLAARALPDWNLQPELVVIDDLDRVSPARVAFIRTMLTCARRAVVVLVGDRDSLPWLAPAHEALQSIVLELGGKVVPAGETEARPNRDFAAGWLQGGAPRSERVKLLRPAARAHEVREAARAIKLAAREGVRLDDICVAMPATGRYRELVEHEFGQAGIPFDAPFEIKLHEAAPVAALLELLRSAHAGLDRADLLDALASPLLNLGMNAEAKAGFLADLRVATREQWVVGGRDIRRDWQRKLQDRPVWPQLDSLLHALAPFTRTVQPAANFIEAVQALLRRTGLEGAVREDRNSARSDPEAATREQALHRFSALLGEMHAEFLRDGNHEIRTADLLRALSEQAGARSVRRPEGDRAAVHVLGLRELRGVRFRRVYCLGLTDEDLPLADQATMFLPATREADLAKVAGPVLARELCAPINTAQQADHLFAHLLLAADEQLVLSLPAAEGDTPLVPALQLARLVAGEEPEKLPAHLGPELPVSVAELATLAARGLTRVEAGAAQVAELPLPPALAAGLHGRCMELARGDVASSPGAYEGLAGASEAIARRFGPDHEFSPSQIDVYAECPQRFWSRYVMRTRPPEEPTLDTPPNAIGTLLHATFEHWVLLLRRQAGQPALLPDAVKRQPVRLMALAQDEPSALALGQRLMSEAFANACAENPTEGPFWQGVKSLVAAGLPGHSAGKGLLARFVETELARNREGKGVRFVEFRFGGVDDESETPRHDAVTTPIELEIPGGRIALRGSIDRVDESDQGLEIIDYKTGQTHVASEVRDGRAFQLPVYLSAVSKLTGSAPQGMTYLRVPIDGAIKTVDVTRYNRKPAYDVAELVTVKLPQRLARILAGIRQGVFVHLPWAEQDTCAWCDYATSCARRPEVIDERQHRPPGIPDVYLPDEAQP